MSDFKAKMHQIQFPLGLWPCRPRWVSLQRSPRPLAVFKGPTSKGRERKRKGQGKGRGRRQRKGRGERTTLRTPCRKFLATPLITTLSTGEGTPNSATVAVFGDNRRFWRQSPNSATVAVFGDTRRIRRL